MESRRTRREQIALATVIALSLFLVSSAVKCSDKQTRRSQAEIDLDNMMNAKIRENLTAASPDVRATDIEVNTFKLMVKLNGQVRSENERNLAIKIARDTEVVKDGGTHKVKEVEAKDLTVKSQ